MTARLTVTGVLVAALVMGLAGRGPSAAEKVSAEGAPAEKAIAEIQKLGGRVTGLDLSSTKVTDAELVHIQGLSQLQTLNLGSTSITDAGLAHLAGLTELQVLDLSSTKVTDAGVAELKRALPKVTIKR